MPADQAPAAYSPVHTDQAPAAQVPAGACKLSSRCTGASRLLVNCRAGPVQVRGEFQTEKPSLLFTCLPGLNQLCPLELGEAARMFTLFHSKC